MFVAHKSTTVAQLRMLVLSPSARGLGLGGRLVDECIAFARAIYAKRGFVLTQSEPYEDFGQSLVGETWELRL